AAVARPLREGRLRDELRLHPDHVVLADARHLWRSRERRGVALERPQLLEQSVDLGVVEPGADVAGPAEPVRAVRPEDERAERPLAPALAARVSRDDELLLAVRLELEPVTRAPPRQGGRGDEVSHEPCR